MALYNALLATVVDRLPDGFTQLRELTHAGLNDISLNRLPTDIGRQALCTVFTYLLRT